MNTELTKKEESCLRLLVSMFIVLMKTMFVYSGLRLLEIDWNIQNCFGLILLAEVATSYIKSK